MKLKRIVTPPPQKGKQVEVGRLTVFAPRSRYAVKPSSPDAVGQGALDQLRNLGNGGFEKLLSSEKLHKAPELNRLSLQSMVTSLEEEVNDSRTKCADLIADLGDAEPCLQHVDKIKELESRLEGMQRLLKQLRMEG